MQLGGSFVLLCSCFWGLLEHSWTSRRIKAINYSCGICLLNAFDEFFMSSCWTVKSIHQQGLSEACRVPNGILNVQWFFFFILHFATGCRAQKGLISCTSEAIQNHILFSRSSSMTRWLLLHNTAGKCSRTSQKLMDSSSTQYPLTFHYFKESL